MEYIKKQNPANAAVFLGQALDAARWLADFFERGRVVLERLLDPRHEEHATTRVGDNGS